jgi:ABC-type uncharacterized transport system substrate-binding protein
MRRRDFTVGLLGAAAARTAGAQPSGKTRRIAIVVPIAPAAMITETAGLFYWRAFFTELRRLGDIEGRNLVVERYTAEGHPERYSELVRQAVNSRPDVILPADNPITLAAQSATRAIPIVALMEDPLNNGIVKSLARPGGNLTGVSADPGLEVWGKNMQLLKEAVPSASKVAVLGLRSTWKGPVVPYMRGAGRKLGISLREELLAETTPSTIEGAFGAILHRRPDAVYVAYDPVFYVHRRLVIDLLQKTRLPAIFFWDRIVRDGGLMSYGDDIADLFRRWARIAHRVLAGTDPGDIPIAQPTKFLLAINLRTAKTLGLTLPPSLVALADEVIS